MVKIMSESIIEKTTEFPKFYPLIFDFGLKALIKMKSDNLIILRDLEKDLLKKEHDLAAEERNLYLNTDFKELGLTNDKLRNSYVKDQLSDSKFAIAEKKHEIQSKKDDIEIIKDLINFKELEVTGE
jgi:hypothetical protein